MSILEVDMGSANCCLNKVTVEVQESPVFNTIYKRDVYGVCEGLAEVAQFNSSTSSGLLVPPIPSSGKPQSYNIIHTHNHAYQKDD